MKTIIENEAYEGVPPKLHDALSSAVWRFNHLVNLEDFPPFRRTVIGPSGEVAIDPPVVETEVGVRFSAEIQDEFWRVNELYDSTSDEQELLHIFSQAFIKLFIDFKDEIAIASVYDLHYGNALSALIAAGKSADQRSEDGWVRSSIGGIR